MARPARLRRAVVLAALTLLAGACGDRVFAIGAPGGSGSSGGADAESTGVIDESDREPPHRSFDDESGDEAPVGFIPHSDAGPESWECDLWAQDCPAGEKCNIWANDGGRSWNATKCVPVDQDADVAGESCTVVESGVSGIDSCVLGAVCWNVDSKTNIGTCIAYCQGGPANPVCEDPTTHCEGRDFSLCLPSCCPLEQECPEGQACYPTNDQFGCTPDASGEEGAFGDACEFLNVCDPGLFCTNPDHVPGCESSGCCSPFCEVGSESCAALDPELQCVPWFEEGQAPPGEELVGACVLGE